MMKRRSVRGRSIITRRRRRRSITRKIRRRRARRIRRRKRRKRSIITRTRRTRRTRNTTRRIRRNTRRTRTRNTRRNNHHFTNPVCSTVLPSDVLHMLKVLKSHSKMQRRGAFKQVQGRVVQML